MNHKQIGVISLFLLVTVYVFAATYNGEFEIELSEPVDDSVYTSEGSSGAIVEDPGSNPYVSSGGTGAPTEEPEENPYDVAGEEMELPEEPDDSPY